MISPNDPAKAVTHGPACPTQLVGESGHGPCLCLNGALKARRSS